MADPPLVTIGLPVYNSERYLRQSLDSLLSQTYRDFTLVISDNASTDQTEAICRDYAASDARIRYFRNAQNIGNPGNFNRVFALANSRYLKWSTSDDYWAPQFLERSLEVMESNPEVVLCYPQCYIVNADGTELTPYDDVLHLMQPDPEVRFLHLIDNIRLAHQHLGLIRMSALARTHLLGAYVGSDINLLAELTLYGRFFELPERLFFRRMHKTSGSWKRGDKAHEAKYYLAASRPKIGLVRWRQYQRFFGAVASAPIDATAKLRLSARLARRMVWERMKLMEELRAKIGDATIRSRAQRPM